MAGRDDSISPMTGPPQPPSPANAESQSPLQPPKSTNSLLSPAAITSTQHSEPGASPTEARDYFSGGLVQALGPSRVAAAGGLQAVVQSTPVPRDSMPDDELHENRDPAPAEVDNDIEHDTQVAGRRSVQFARSKTMDSSGQGPGEESDTPGKSRSAAFMYKLKAFKTNAGTPTVKSPGTPTVPSELGTQSLTNSPTAPRVTNRAPDALVEEQSDADADVETADEAAIPDQGSSSRKQRKSRRFKKGRGSSPSGPSWLPSDSDTLSTYNRLLRRRASMPDPSEQDRAASDGEVRDQPRRRPFLRGHTWMNATMSPPDEDIEDLEGSAAVGRRAGHTRRMTVFGGGAMSDGDALTSKRHFFTSERASSYGAQKWKQVKNTLKLLRQKKEDRFDYYKSAELMAELRAGAPAVLMLASMIQRDEHGNKRIPVLLEQLKVSIKDSCPMPDDDKERHWIFTFQLEYGSGPSRMSWTVIRTIRDIYNLHLRYKFALNNDKYKLGRPELGARPRQPKFPYSAFPYLRGARNKGDESDDEDQPSERGEEAPGEAEDGIISGGEGLHRPSRRKSRGNFLGMRRRSTVTSDSGDTSSSESEVDTQNLRQRYVDKQRRILEKYLSEMIRWLMFRADSNRLCRFLELSALGVRLAAEGSYHGKEGYLHIQTSKGLDFRRVLTPAKVIARHSRKWFLVRQSYIVCVESPENMNIYDVYLVDSNFGILSKRNPQNVGSKEKASEVDLTAEAPRDKHHTLTLHTSERKVRLFSRNQSVMRQFEASINEMLRQTPWYEKHRFESFAPVRNGVFAQWLVDGRDYMWNVSRAINMARDVIYIHDWWLSPEFYMRRPACISQKWRLDRLLQKKAREGVKIFIIIYRNVEAAVPIDSEYTKFSLLNLHPNIFVQRSPNQFKKNQFFFAHHEKICIVDHDVAFLGGIDLCFGRWDCPQHPIVDDKPTGFEPSETPKDAEHCQLFPGKDYSNPRVQDFFRLNEPYEEMYDRGKVPRMPWHDVGMQVVGQPARDLTRHFVQRWNYLRRGRKPTRPLPFLLPAPDAKFEDLEALGLTGTCEVQILRSAANWSLGVHTTEHSIQTAYVKMIEDSEHFVYMENQFFITSTEIYGTKIVNRIGDALVERIIRAHTREEDWRCVIIIPLMPGFQNTVDEQEGTSVRLILMCQFRSICRGEHSIFGRLRAAGIEPEDYISFYSLRQWGVMANDVLVTEQLYIHAKAMVVDDRIALIGSANINERSLLGNRDSEIAAIVRDTDMIWSTMAGKPYQVGRFAHSLRLRLMREHLGLDVDEILEEEREQEMDGHAFEHEMDDIYEDDRTPAGEDASSSSQQLKSTQEAPLSPLRLPSFNHELDLARAEATEPTGSHSKGKAVETDPRVTGNKEHALDVSGYGPDHWKAAEKSGCDEGRDSVVINGREVLVHNVGTEGKATVDAPKPASPVRQTHLEHGDDESNGNRAATPPLSRETADQQEGVPTGVEQNAALPTLDTHIGGHSTRPDSASGRPVNGAFHPLAAEIRPALIDKDCMRDPIHPNFIEEVWNRVAANNTLVYRKVFRCMPDSKVGTWAEYREHMEYSERFRASMEGRPASDESELHRETSQQRVPTATSAGVGASGPEAQARAVDADAEKVPEQEDRPKIQLPEHEDAGVDGNQPARNGTGEQQSLRPHAGDGAMDNQGSLEPPSPVYAAGDVPFPVMDTSPSSKLLGQGKTRDRRTTFSTLEKPSSKETSTPPSAQVGSVKRRRRATTKGSRRGFLIDDMPSRSDAEEMLKMVQGNLVEFPYDWLLTEENNGNWGYQVDGVAPLTIYN